jgi:hypothetical protein
MVVFLLLVFTAGGKAIAQSPNFPVRASVTVVNPSPYLEDYGRDGNVLVVLTLVDNQPNYQGLLRITVEGNGYRAETRDLLAQSPISLGFGAPVILRGPDLAPYFDLNNLNVEGISTDNTLGNGGALPDGPITICVEVYDVNRFTDPPVSNPACAIRFVQQNYPPELVRPLGQVDVPLTQTLPEQSQGFGREGVSAPSISVLNFSWNPRHVPQPADDEYVMELWKKVPGLTNDQIIRSSGRSQQPVITQIPRYTYTNYDSRLEIGTKYIWRVQVRDRRGVRQFVNDGFSEIGEFIYGKIPQEEVECLGADALFAANVTDTEATISWENPTATTSNGYQIRYRAVDQGNWILAGSAPITATLFSLTSLNPETDYEVEVCANCKSGAPVCSSIPFTTLVPELIDCGPMPDPTTFAITNNSLRVIWDHIPQADGYVLSWQKLPNPGDPIQAQQQIIRLETDGGEPEDGGDTGPTLPDPNRLEFPAGTTEAVTNSNLQAGYIYRLKLCKICLDGREECIEWEVPFNGYVDYCSEDVQPNVAVVSGSESQNNMDLGWTYSGMNVLPEGYDLRVVYHPTADATTPDTLSLAGAMTGTTVTGLSVGTDYTFELCVLCPDGEERCATTTGTTDPFSCPDPLELEAAVIVTPVVPDGILVDWSELGPATSPVGWSFALLNMAGDTLQKATAETGYQTSFTGLDSETEYRVAICHQCPVGEPQCSEKTIFLPGCEAAELELAEGTVHFDFVELSWTDVGAEKYTVTFSEQGGDPLAEPQTTEDTDFRLGGLTPLTSYEISVCFECGIEPICDTIVVTTIGVNCALAGDYEYDFECGINVSLQNPENQLLVETLNPGDSIWAGDFLVEIAEITGNTTFGGFGRTKIPYLKNAKLRLDFHEIQVNENCRMVAGKMVIKSPLEAALEQLQQGLQDLQDILGEIDDFLGSLSATLGSISSVLDQIATAADVTAEANAVLAQLVIALDQVPYLPDSYVDAVEDAADCLKLAALAGDDEAVRNCRDQLQEAIQNAQDYIDDLFDADFIVDFAPTVPATAYWGLDSQRYDLITESYDQRTIGGTPYKVPWASTSTEEPSGVPFGAVRRDNGTMQPVNFIGSDTQPWPNWTKDGTSASNPGLSADGDQEIKVVFAAHDNPDAVEGNDSIPPVKLAGQLNLITYTPVRHTVHIVPINNAALPQGAEQVEAALNRIYRSAVAEWTVAIEPNINVDDFAGTLQDIPNSLLSNYTPQMNSLKNEIKNQAYYDGDHYYLLVVPRMAEPTRAGFMPRKRSFGFLSAERLTDGETFNRTTAHELAHGAFHLQHVYDRFEGVAAGSTDNLMDSGGGETLFKYQWDNVHDPESNFTLFDEEEEGEYITFNLVEYFRKDTTEHDEIDYLTFVSNRGMKVHLPIDSIVQLVFATGGEAYVANDDNGKTFIPIGSLVKFVLRGDNQTYINCSGGNYVQKEWGTGNCSSNDGTYPNPVLTGETKPIACRHAVKASVDYAHYVVLSPQAYLYDDNTGLIPPYDVYVKEFYEISSPGVGSIKSVENIKNIENAGEITLSGQLANPVFQALYSDPELAQVFDYDYPASYYASGLAYLIAGMEEEASTCETFANNTRGLWMRRSAAIIATGVVDMFNTSIDVADGIGTAKVSETEKLIGFIYDSGYYGAEGPTKQELATAIVNVSWRGGKIAEYNARLAAMNGDAAVADSIILDLFSDDGYLVPCEIDGLTFNDYESLELFITQLFNFGNFTQVFGWYFEDLGFSNDTEWFFTKFIRKVSPEDYVKLLTFLESEIPNTPLGTKHYYEEILEAVEDDLFSSNGTTFITFLLKAYEAVIIAPEANKFKTEYDSFKTIVNTIELENALNLDLSVHSIADLKVVPYNYTGILNRVNWGNLLCKSSISLHYWCDWDKSIFPATEITSVKINDSGNMEVYQRNKYVLLYSTSPEDLKVTLRPFEPFILDKESSFADAKKLLQNPGGEYKVMPGFVMKFLEENATNQTVEDVVFTAIDVATIAFPITKVATIARVLAYADKASSVLGIAATYAQGDSTITPEVKTALNLTSAFLGLVSMSDVAFSSLSAADNVTDVKNVAKNLDKTYTAAAAADNTVAAGRFNELLDHIDAGNINWTDAAHSTDEFMMVKQLMAKTLSDNVDDLENVAGITRQRVNNAIDLLGLTADFADFRALFVSRGGWDWATYFNPQIGNYINSLPSGTRYDIHGAFENWPNSWPDGFTTIMNNLAANVPFQGFNNQILGSIDGNIRTGKLNDALDEAITHSADPEIISLRGQSKVLDDDILAGVLSYETILLRRDAIRQQLINRVPWNVTGTEGFVDAVRTRVIDHVIVANTQEAITEMLTAASNAEEYQSALIMQGRFKALQDDIVAGLVGAEDITRETNKIVEAVLNTLPNSNVLSGGLTNVELALLVRRLNIGDVTEAFIDADRFSTNSVLADLENQMTALFDLRNANSISYEAFTIGRNQILWQLLDALPVVPIGTGGITEAVKQTLKQDIADYRLPDYFSRALASNVNPTMQKMILQIKGRYVALTKDINNGVVSVEDARVFENQIMHSMLDILNDAEFTLQTPRQTATWDVLRIATNNQIPLFAVDITLINRLADDLDLHPNLKPFLEENGVNGFLAWKYGDDALPNRPWCTN